jgi:hypothetical protein
MDVAYFRNLGSNGFHSFFYLQDTELEEFVIGNRFNRRDRAAVSEWSVGVVE